MLFAESRWIKPSLFHIRITSCGSNSRHKSEWIMDFDPWFCLGYIFRRSFILGWNRMLPQRLSLLDSDRGFLSYCPWNYRVICWSIRARQWRADNLDSRILGGQCRGPELRCWWLFSIGFLLPRHVLSKYPCTWHPMGYAKVQLWTNRCRPINC